MEKLLIDGLVKEQATRSVHIGEFRGKKVIIKDNQKQTRFQNELRVYKKLSLSGMSDISKPFPELFFADETAQRLVVEYIAGRPISDFIQNSLGISDATLRYNAVKGFLNAVAYFHDNGIAHLDLHPENVLHDTEKNRTVLIDYDVAIVDAKGENTANNYPRPALTRSTFYAPNIPSVTIHPPELFIAGEINPFKSDLYTVSSTLIQIFWGMQPLVGSVSADFSRLDLAKVEHIIRLSKHFSQEQESLLSLILTNMALNSEERSVSVSSLLQCVDKLQNDMQADAGQVGTRRSMRKNSDIIVL